MKNQYPTFSMDAVRGADLIQRHKAGLGGMVPHWVRGRSDRIDRIGWAILFPGPGPGPRPGPRTRYRSSLAKD